MERWSRTVGRVRGDLTIASRSQSPERLSKIDGATSVISGKIDSTSPTSSSNLPPGIWESSRISRYYFAWLFRLLRSGGCARNCRTRSVELMGRAWNELIFHRGVCVSFVKRDKKCPNTSTVASVGPTKFFRNVVSLPFS